MPIRYKMDLSDRGYLNPQDPKTAHEIRKKHGLEGLATEYSIDYGKMKRIIDKLKNDGDYEPVWWDNPHIMYSVLREYAQSSGYAKLVEQKTQVGERVDELLKYYYEKAGLAEEKFQDRANQGTEPRPMTQQPAQQNLLNPVPTGQPQVV